MSFPVDKIANAVYAWEKSYVEPRPALYLSSEQVVDLARQASWKENIPVPIIRFVKSNSLPCQAHIDTWMIDIADWGRTPCTVLHEVAHLATLPALAKGEDPHGPSFVTKCIDLYHHFIKIPLEHLCWSATRSGLQYHPFPAAQRKTQKSSFEDIEF